MRLLVGRDDDDRQPGLQCADRRQPGKAMIARHMQVQQHQIDLLALDCLQHAIQRIGLADLQVHHRFFGRAMQRRAEQGVVIGDEQGRHVESRLANSFAGEDGYLGTLAHPHGIDSVER
ncbi:hypothetical protein D3C81_1275410 [compost metagenome]